MIAQNSSSQTMTRPAMAGAASGQTLALGEALLLANRMRESGELESAEQLCDEIAVHAPASADLLHLRGLVAAERGDPKAALRHMARAMALAPENEGLRGNLVQACRRGYGASAERPLGDFKDSLSDRECPITVALTRLLVSLGEIELALAEILQRQSAGTVSAEELTIAGTALNEAGAFAAAYQCFARAHEIAPDDPKIARSLGLATFRHGDLARGLALYEARWRLTQFDSIYRDFPFPLWGGEALEGRRLLVWAEQGVGDQVMQSRVLGRMKNPAQLAVECDPRLIPLLSRRWPAVEFPSQTVKPSQALLDGSFDFHTSMLSAWRWLLPDTLQGKVAKPYLRADKKRVRSIRRDCGIGAGDNQLQVGLSWRSAQAQRGPGRSIDPFLLRPLLADDRLKFYSLQYDATDDEIARLNRDLGTNLVSVPGIDMRGDLDGVAATIAALDLVISTDNTTVHLAGALGKPTWVMLNHRHDWRWLDGSPDTP